MTNQDNERKDKAREEYERAVDLNLDSRRRLTGLLVGGNAGGAVALLTVFGSMLTSASQNPIPKVLFWLFTAFLLGLFACLVERFADRRIRGMIAFEKSGPALFGVAMDLGQSGANQKWSEIQHWLQIFSFATLVCGTIIGLYFLYDFT